MSIVLGNIWNIYIIWR